MAERKLVTLTNLETFADELKKKYKKQEDAVSQLDSRVTSLEEGIANKIEKIKVNGEEQTINQEDKSVDIKVPTKVSELNNDKKYQTDAEVAASIAEKLTSTYKAGGSKQAESLNTAPTSDQEGVVYNISEPFETTDNGNFIEGLNASYPAGTNVVAVKQEDGTYKWDVLAGFVDLSDYAKTAEVDKKIEDTVANLGTKDGFAKTEEVHQYVTKQLENYYDKSEIDTKFEDYYTKIEVDTKLEDYVKNSDIVEITAPEIQALLADA